jgi:2-phospho-L-lactate guanylyltransferase (CobY/MobA/RfbA family)
MILKVTRLRERLSAACRSASMVSLVMNVLESVTAQAQSVKVVINDRGGLLG